MRIHSWKSPETLKHQFDLWSHRQTALWLRSKPRDITNTALAHIFNDHHTRTKRSLDLARLSRGYDAEDAGLAP